jgi:hypothetical protein
MRYGSDVNSFSSCYHNGFILSESHVLVLTLHRHNLKTSVAIIKGLVHKDRHLFLHSHFNQMEQTIHVEGLSCGKALHLCPRGAGF